MPGEHHDQGSAHQPTERGQEERERLSRADGQDFECRWLTCWPEDRINALLHLVYANDLSRLIKYQNWKIDGGKAESALAASRDFWWLENPLPSSEMQQLNDAGLAGRFIAVKPSGIWGFDNAVKELYRRSRIEAGQL